MTRADGKSLLKGDRNTRKPIAELPVPGRPDYTSFTLGSVNVSPLSMAEAYATVASGGIYCAPTRSARSPTPAGKSLPVPSAGCHRVLSSDVANAASYILQGVFTWQGATGAGLGPLPSGYPIAGKTGTSNVASGNGTPYAAFAGLHHRPGQLHLGVQPGLAHGEAHDGRRGFLLTAISVATLALPGRDVRRQRARLDLAADVRLGQPRRVARLRDGLPEQRAVEQGQRPVRPAAAEEAAARAAARAATAAGGGGTVAAAAAAAERPPAIHNPHKRQ